MQSVTPSIKTISNKPLQIRRQSSIQFPFPTVHLYIHVIIKKTNWFNYYYMKTLKDIFKNQTVLKVANSPNFSLNISLILRTEPCLLIIDPTSYSSWKSTNFRFCIYLLNIYYKNCKQKSKKKNWHHHFQIIRRTFPEQYFDKIKKQEAHL